MHYNDLIQLYFDRSNAIQWYWTLYVVIAGGLLAFSSLRQKPAPVVGILITVLFCCFAYKNLDALHDSTVQRFATLDAIKAYPSVMGIGEVPNAEKARALLEPTLTPPAWEGVRIFHVTSDVLILLTLWAMELRRMAAWRRERVTPA